MEPNKPITSSIKDLIIQDSSVSEEINSLTEIPDQNIASGTSSDILGQDLLMRSEQRPLSPQLKKRNIKKVISTKVKVHTSTASVRKSSYSNIGDLSPYHSREASPIDTYLDEPKTLLVHPSGASNYSFHIPSDSNLELLNQADELDIKEKPIKQTLTKQSFLSPRDYSLQLNKKTPQRKKSEVALKKQVKNELAKYRKTIHEKIKTDLAVENVADLKIEIPISLQNEEKELLKKRNEEKQILKQEMEKINKERIRRNELKQREMNKIKDTKEHQVKLLKVQNIILNLYDVELFNKLLPFIQDCINKFVYSYCINDIEYKMLNNSKKFQRSLSIITFSQIFDCYKSSQYYNNSAIISNSIFNTTEIDISLLSKSLSFNRKLLHLIIENKNLVGANFESRSNSILRRNILSNNCPLENMTDSGYILEIINTLITDLDTHGSISFNKYCAIDEQCDSQTITYPDENEIIASTKEAHIFILDLLNDINELMIDIKINIACLELQDLAIKMLSHLKNRNNKRTIQKLENKYLLIKQSIEKIKFLTDYYYYHSEIDSVLEFISTVLSGIEESSLYGIWYENNKDNVKVYSDEYIIFQQNILIFVVGITKLIDNKIKQKSKKHMQFSTYKLDLHSPIKTSDMMLATFRGTAQTLYAKLSHSIIIRVPNSAKLSNEATKAYCRISTNRQITLAKKGESLPTMLEHVKQRLTKTLSNTSTSSNDWSECSSRCESPVDSMDSPSSPLVKPLFAEASPPATFASIDMTDKDEDEESDELLSSNIKHKENE